MTGRKRIRSTLARLKIGGAGDAPASRPSHNEEASPQRFIARLTIVALLAVLLAAPAFAETFTLGLLNGGCWEGDGPNRRQNNVRNCRPEDSLDNMVGLASLEVTCRSDLIHFKGPTKLRYEPTGMVRTRYNGELIDMPASVAAGRFGDMISRREAITPDHESRETWLLDRFIDVWVGGPGNSDQDPGGTSNCGGRPVGLPELCVPIETSEGPILSPYYGVGGVTPRLPAIEFDVPREALWDYLRQRAEDRERFDTNQSGESETPLLKVYLYDVVDPEIPKMKDRDRYLRAGESRHGMPASSWYMIGTVDWNGIVVTPTYRGFRNLGQVFKYTPAVLHDELNRLQDFYEACQANFPETDLSDVPMEPAAVAARSAVRALRNDSATWDRWKGVTLEQFADTK